MRADIMTEHVEEAVFLRRRLRRSHALLDGNAKQTRSLEARIAAHLDALRLYGEAVHTELPAPERARDPATLYVSAMVAGDALAALGDARLDHEGFVALRDAARDGGKGARRVVEGWLAEGDDSARAVGVALLAAWGDPRAEKVATRAVKRGEGALRAAGVCALGALGIACDEGAVLDAMRGSDERGWRDAVLAATARAAPAVALAVARGWDGPRCDLAWVLLGMSDDGEDQDRLLDAFAMAGPVGALPAGLALAGAHPALDGAWEGGKLAASNALREAAYVVIGGEAPPVVVRDEMSEEPEDTAQRRAEDAVLRAELARREAAPWRWGARASGEALRRGWETLGPRPRGWCAAGMALRGERVECEIGG